MKKQFSAVSLILMLCFYLITPSGCNNNNGPNGNTGTITDDNQVGFAAGHVIKGRYSNSDQGIRSFTFYTDETFEKGAASSGDFNGGDFVTGGTSKGTYYLSGNTIKLTFENGESQELPIEVKGMQRDYSSETPVQITINHVIYTNVE